MWVVWATVACVNLRFLVFSFQYRPYFAHLPRNRRIVLSYFMGDTIFAMFLRRYPAAPRARPGGLLLGRRAGELRRVAARGGHGHRRRPRHPAGMGHRLRRHDGLLA